MLTHLREIHDSRTLLHRLGYQVPDKSYALPQVVNEHSQQAIGEQHALAEYPKPGSSGATTIGEPSSAFSLFRLRLT